MLLCFWKRIYYQLAHSSIMSAKYIIQILDEGSSTDSVLRKEIQQIFPNCVTRILRLGQTFEASILDAQTRWHKFCRSLKLKFQKFRDELGFYCVMQWQFGQNQPCCCCCGLMIMKSQTNSFQTNKKLIASHFKRIPLSKNASENLTQTKKGLYLKILIKILKSHSHTTYDPFMYP